MLLTWFAIHHQYHLKFLQMRIRWTKFQRMSKPITTLLKRAKHPTQEIVHLWVDVDDSPLPVNKMFKKLRQKKMTTRHLKSWRNSEKLWEMRNRMVKMKIRYKEGPEPQVIMDFLECLENQWLNKVLPTPPRQLLLQIRVEEILMHHKLQAALLEMISQDRSDLHLIQITPHQNHLKTLYSR
eukprot:NODE_50_length_31184_cov_0.705099.p23 type:complete len:182 gc:universal NODE_50_length_31184_cov_0.705099:25554-26099(+)